MREIDASRTSPEHKGHFCSASCMHLHFLSAHVSVWPASLCDVKATTMLRDFGTLTPAALTKVQVRLRLLGFWLLTDKLTQHLRQTAASSFLRLTRPSMKQLQALMTFLVFSLRPLIVFLYVPSKYDCLCSKCLFPFYQTKQSSTNERLFK